ncbi:MAG TPA: hypothetical protein VG028_03230 [Terriglobia bacterium]|nr:hypothetical protein [Terriglobia bacterium]
MNEGGSYRYRTLRPATAGGTATNLRAKPAMNFGSEAAAFDLVHTSA